jgi:lysine 2,3-aminomutase
MDEYKGLEKLLRDERICLTPESNIRMKRRNLNNECR